MNLYSDSIVDEPCQMLNPNESQRAQGDHQEKLGVGDRTFHCSYSPYIDEFSELVKKPSLEVLKHTLLTYQQRLLAEALWAAENFGGSETKCVNHLKEIYGSSWRSMTSISDHMRPVREYYELVLILDHEQQWAKVQKNVKLREEKTG